jgi:hypothetical protein
MINIKEGDDLVQVLIYFNRHVVSIWANITEDDICFSKKYEIFTNSYSEIIVEHPNFNDVSNNTLVSPTKTIILSYLTAVPTSCSLIFDLITDSLKLFNVISTNIITILEEFKLYYKIVGKELLNCIIEVQNYEDYRKVFVNIEQYKLIDSKEITIIKKK